MALLVVSLVGLAGTPARAAPPPELGEIKGKLVWVDFWASWCVPCRRSFPWLNQMQARYGGQGLQVIGVNLDEQRGAADAFLKEVPARFTLKFDPAGKLAVKFNVQAMPSSFLLDASGNVLASHAGFRLAESAAYEAEIKKALTGSK
jgi:cytochrome c biogenesis protein CcmG/thiol:disulfide interchange protein DsbE